MSDEAPFVLAVAREQGFRPFQQLVRHGVDGRRQAAQQARDVAIARVHVRRDLLQEDDEERLKSGQLGELLAKDRQRAVDRLAGGLLNRHVAVEVIDERRVERLLLFEQRCDDAANAVDEALRQTGGSGAAP